MPTCGLSWLRKRAIRRKRKHTVLRSALPPLLLIFYLTVFVKIAGLAQMSCSTACPANLDQLRQAVQGMALKWEVLHSVKRAPIHPAKATFSTTLQFVERRLPKPDPLCHRRYHTNGSLLIAVPAETLRAKLRSGWDQHHGRQFFRPSLVCPTRIRWLLYPSKLPNSPSCQRETTSEPLNPTLRLFFVH